MEIEFVNGGLIVTVEREIYNLDVLHKCFYWYGADFSIDISSKSETLLSITVLTKKNVGTQIDFVGLSEKIKRDVIDFKLRDIVTKETQNIRELLTAKAFAYYDQIEDPITDVSDPVGFNPNSK